ncbi:MAG TPA: hypothetical protein VII13_05595 [Vicinamibacteria bacterium]|jgi:hypothetical protein
MRVQGLVVMLLLVSGVASAQDQNLGELAAREKERRERDGKKPAKTYTEYELGTAGKGTVSQPGAVDVVTPAAATTTTAAAAGTAAKAGEKPAEKTEDELRAERETAWRQQVTEARDEVTRLQTRIGELQNSLNDLTATLYGTNRTGLLNQMEQARKDLGAAQQKVADLEEEGRRNRYR